MGRRGVGRDVCARAGRSPGRRTARRTSARRASAAWSPTWGVRRARERPVGSGPRVLRDGGRRGRDRRGRPTDCPRSRRRRTTRRRWTTSAMRTDSSSRRAIGGAWAIAAQDLAYMLSTIGPARSSVIAIARRNSSSRAKATSVLAPGSSARSATSATTAVSTPTPSRSCGRRARHRSRRETATPKRTHC